MIKIKIKKNTPNAFIPRKAHVADAAFDLYVPRNIEIGEGRNIIDLEFSMEIPDGYAATIQPRSGFSAKGFEAVAESFGTTKRFDADVIRGLIDSNYRGSVGVIVYVKRGECKHTNIVIERGTRIAQMQIVEVPQCEFVEAEELSDTDRSDGGYGSTGSK